MEREGSTNATDSEGSVTHIDDLPFEMLSHILGFITLPEQLKLAVVSRRWRQAVNICVTQCRHYPTGNKSVRATNATLEKVLSRLPGLHSLTNISGDNLDVDIISRHCPQLVEAQIYSFRLDVPSLERLCRSCPKLESLCLSHSCDDACVEAVLRGLPGLRSLDLYLTNVTGRCLALLPPTLQRLGLHGEWKLDQAELERAARCPALRELEIAIPSYTPPCEMAGILSVCPRLEKLNAEDSNITDEVLEMLPEMTPGLRDLNLSNCIYATCDGLKSLGRLKELRSLNLFETDTDDEVLEQLQGAFHLTKLTVGPDAFNAPDFSIDTLARLVVSCPSLRRVTPSVMVDSTGLASALIGRLGPDRDVTIEMSAECVREMEETLPKDGPLRVAEWPYYD